MSDSRQERREFQKEVRKLMKKHKQDAFERGAARALKLMPRRIGVLPGVMTTVVRGARMCTYKDRWW